MVTATVGRRGDPTLARRLTIGALAAAAVAAGFTTALSPVYAIGLAATALLGVAVAADVRWVPVVLVLTVFAESVAVGAASIGRLAAPLAVLVVGYQIFVRGRATLRWSALLVLVAAYGVWLTLALYWSPPGGYGYRSLLEWGVSAAYMLAFAGLLRGWDDIAAVGGTFGAAALVFGLIGSVGYFTGHLIDQDGRAVGLQGDPNYFALYEVAALPLALAFGATQRRAALRAVMHAAVVAIVLSVAVSLSRTAMLALAVAVLATLLAPARLFFRRRAEKLAYMVAIVAAVGIVGVTASSVVASRLETLTGGATTHDPTSGRSDLWAAATRGFRSAPWTGLGTGGFEARSLQLLQETPGVDTTASYVRAGRPVHNAYLGVATNLGVVGGVLFAALLVLTGRSFFGAWSAARRARHVRAEAFALALLVTLFVYAVGALFLSIEHSKILWILIGLAIAVEAQRREPARAAAARDGVFAIVNRNRR